MEPVGPVRAETRITALRDKPTKPIVPSTSAPQAWAGHHLVRPPGSCIYGLSPVILSALARNTASLTSVIFSSAAPADGEDHSVPIFVVSAGLRLRSESVRGVEHDAPATRSAASTSLVSHAALAAETLHLQFDAVLLHYLLLELCVGNLLRCPGATLRDVRLAHSVVDGWRDAEPLPLWHNLLDAADSIERRPEVLDLEMAPQSVSHSFLELEVYHGGHLLSWQLLPTKYYGRAPVTFILAKSAALTDILQTMGAIMTSMPTATPFTI